MKRPSTPSVLATLALLVLFLATPVRGSELPRLSTFELTDQFGHTHRIVFPRDRPLLLLIGDRRGSEEIEAWLLPLKEHWGRLADIAGIADVSAVPRFLRNRIREGIRKERPRPLMLDFEGAVTEGLGCSPRTANLLVVDRDGRTLRRLIGKPDDAKLAGIRTALESGGPTPAPAPEPPKP